jgi:hypothetical protein
MLHRLSQALNWLLLVLLLSSVLSGSNPASSDPVERIRAFTRSIEFDYTQWMLKAIGIKFQQGSLNLPGPLGHEARKQIVSEYLRLTQQILEGENLLTQLYADPSVSNKEQASANLRASLNALYQRQEQLAPLSEAILQDQVTQTLAEAGLTTGGEPIPPVLYHATAVPMALVVSPRDRIEQTANISLLPDLSLEKQIQLEDQVASTLDVSTLVVPIGGVGVYPTMIMRTTDLAWLLNTIAHEWTHNYLTLHPLGVLYDHTPELRTMNETTASIVGNEIGELTLKRFYPELASGSPRPFGLISSPLDHPDPGSLPRPPFDFRAEMHTTRVTVDALLAEGKIAEAEAYMEQRRQLFLQHGYLIRKLNQAYFAFYGAYADVPGGAAGEDPVGPAVRALRAQSRSLKEFVQRIAWMTSFEQLQEAVQNSAHTATK